MISEVTCFVRLQMDQVVRCLKDEDIKMAKITHDFF